MTNIELANNTVTINGKDIELTPQESALLKVLINEKGKIVSRDYLLKDAWGYQSAGITRTVDVHIQRLRRKIGAKLIETVYRAGYRLATA